MPEVTTNPKKVKPALKPPGNEGASDHANAPTRLRSPRIGRGNKGSRDKGINR